MYGADDRKGSTHGGRREKYGKDGQRYIYEVGDHAGRKSSPFNYMLLHYCNIFSDIYGMIRASAVLQDRMARSEMSSYYLGC